MKFDLFFIYHIKYIDHRYVRSDYVLSPTMLLKINEGYRRETTDVVWFIVTFVLK